MVAKLPFCCSLCLLSMAAQADFVVCNAGRTLPMFVAWASQQVTLVQFPYVVSGWTQIGPGRCDMLATGDVGGTNFWIRAVSNNVVLPPGRREQGSPLNLSQQQFCVANNDFEYNGAGPGVTSACAAGYTLATFPVQAFMPGFVGDFRVEMNPDEFFASADTPGSGPKLPDLYGAMTMASDGMQYTWTYESSRAAARDGALAYCHQMAPQATCQVMRVFKNQCLAVAVGKTNYFVKVGQPDWTEQQTMSAALNDCNSTDGPGCQSGVSSCATWAAKAEQRDKRDAQIQRNVMDGMDKMLKQLWR